MELIYPTSIHKYTGNIRSYKVKKETHYSARIETADYRISKAFSSYNEAENFLKNKNRELNLPIKNIIRNHGTYMEVHLGNGKFCKFEPEDEEIVQKHTWGSDGVGYARAFINNKSFQMHNLIMGHTPGDLTVDHTNGDKLDNRCHNLRLATRREQTINQKISARNNSGIIGVFKERNSWRATVSDKDGNLHRVSFGIKKFGDVEAKNKAIQARHQLVQRFEGYDFLRK